MLIWLFFVDVKEWLSSTPKHVVLYDAFGWPKPIFAHLPLLLNADKTKLSKRFNHAHVQHYKVTLYSYAIDVSRI
jgi:glutamyl-tRNA synthetase